mgnify:CR=1
MEELKKKREDLKLMHIISILNKILHLIHDINKRLEIIESFYQK